MTKKFEIDTSQYKILNKIKTDGFISAFSVQNIKTNETLVAKIINTHDLPNKQIIKHDIGAIIRMKHPTIIKFYGYSLKDFNGNDNITILMQLAPKGSLAELLSKAQQGLSDNNYDNTARQKILIGVARGMMYLHQHHTLHRNLKPENILLDDNLEPNITDFELFKFVNTNQLNDQTENASTLIHMSPEAIVNGQYNGKSDVYSFGILMYEIITESNPYPLLQQNKITLSELKTKISTENYRPEFITPMKPKLKELIELCLSQDPLTRPTFEEIYNRLSQNVEGTVYNTYNTCDLQYYLDNVDTDELFTYIDKIENSPTVDHNRLFEKMHQLKHTIKTLEKQNNELLTKVDRLSIENSEIRQQLSSISLREPKIGKDEIRLHVKILEATDLVTSPTKRKHTNPLVTLHLKSRKDQSEESTDYKPNTRHPVWNEEFDLFTTERNDVLLVNMYNIEGSDDENDENDDGDEGDGDDCYEPIMDEIQYPINDLKVGGPLVKKELEIKRDGGCVGKLYFEVQLFKTDIEPYCTFSATGEHFIKQKVYSCLTCNLTPENDMGICEACAKKCHIGHDIRFDSVRPEFYCDCPSKCKCNCMPMSSELPCTSAVMHGNPINQPMFYCKDCDGSCKYFICQNCATRFHHGHDLIYLGIVESKVCQNEMIGGELVI